MRFTTFSLSALLLAFSASHINAQNATDIVSHLKSLGFTTLAQAVTNISSTEVGKNLISQLGSGGNFTVFAPTNDAFKNSPNLTTVADTPDKLASVLSYHVAQGNFANSSVPSGNASHLVSASFPSVIVARTLLSPNGSQDFVNLEANKSQVVIWTNNGTNQTRYFLNQSPTITMLNATNINSTSNYTLLLVPITGVLIPPGTFTEVANENTDLISSTAGLLAEVNSESGQGSLAQQVQSNWTRGCTCFIPSNDAIKAAGNAVTSLGSNQTAAQIVLGNHIVNGTSLYSTQLNDKSSLISISGEGLSVSTNSSGTYVASGNVTAKIVKADVLVENGVAHIIDQVLLNTNENQQAASSAYVSATSTAAAGASSTATGPVTAQTSSSSTGGKKNGAGQLSVNGLGGSAAGMILLGMLML